MNVLFVTIILPGALFGGGEVWSQTIIDGLRRQGCNVEVLGYQRRPGPLKPGEQAVGIRTVESSYAPLSAIGWGTRSLLSGQPYTVQKWVGPAFSAKLRNALAARRWDLVVINHAGPAWALDEIDGIPIVHVSHQGEAQLYHRHASATQGWRSIVYGREAKLLRTVETRLARQAAAIWCIADHDQAYFHAIGAQRAVVLPPLPRSDWAIGTKHSAGHGPEVALLGSWTWKPNRESLRWFLGEVQPRLPRDWMVAIGGKYDPAAFSDFPQANFVGVVNDPCAFLRASKRIAVPSRGGLGGAPLKLLDAIAAIRPVVTNIEAIMRIGPVPRHVIGASSAAAFAAALNEAPYPDPDETTVWLSTRRAQFDALLEESLFCVLG